MSCESEEERSGPARILMFSQRNLFENFHYRCALYEFEDLICQLDSVRLLAPRPSKWFKYGFRVAHRLARDCGMAINPGIPKLRIEGTYEMFFALCQFPEDLLHIEALEGWRDQCKISICWLNEIYASGISRYRRYLEILSKFDHVILISSQSAKAVNKVIGDKSVFQPFGIDAIQFCPYPTPPQRMIDVYSIGRRSKETHQALLRMAQDNRIFYVYDTINGQTVIDPKQHRLLYANMAKRSRYFVVNPGKIDCTEETGGQDFVGFRFYEGAGAGTIMVGEHPKNEEFLRVFDWPDAVVQLPYNSTRIGEVISELDQQPDRQERIRRNNVVQSLLRHDWLYRWEAVLKAAFLEPMPELLERKRRLATLCEIVQETGRIG
jgi:hypothetical protein